MAKAIPKAKGKIKRQELADEEKFVSEHFEKEYAEIHESDQAKVEKAEISTKEVLNVLADEIEEIYELNGQKIDRANSMEKARILYLEIRYKAGAKVAEKEFDLPYCKDHV
jgi:hypothetical protein